MRPRATDWSLALSVGAAFASGLWSLVAGRAEQWWIFALHGAAGLWLALLLVGKLRRVWGRIAPRRDTGWPATYRDWRTYAGIATTLFALLALATGIGWTAGGELVLLGYNILNWHVIFGFALTLLVSLHMIVQARPLRRADLRGRRQALRFGGLLLGGALLWPSKEWLQERLRLPGAARRFTGSREIGSFAGNGGFPTVSWMADRPRPLDPATWQLMVGGAVARPLALDYAAVVGDDSLTATLDCTGGFYTTQEWRGVLVGRLLDQAGIDPTARWVRFVSVTGYRWSLPLAEARAALIATHVGGEALRHGHGGPARLVAPDQRGLVWVKWLVAIEARHEADPGQLLAINLSGLTPEGSGEV